MVMFSLSLTLNQPGDTFKASIYFGQFQAIAAEQQWAYAFAIIGMLGLWGLGVTNTVIQLVTVAILATAHGVIALCFFLGTPATAPYATGLGPYSIYALLGYYVVWRRFAP